MLAGCRPRVFGQFLFSQGPWQQVRLLMPPSQGTLTARQSSNILIPASDEELCLADLSDYQSVVRIDPNIHSGLDRLPYHYQSYIGGAGVRGYLYKKGNKVIGFASINLVDGGQTLTGLAGRLAPEYRTGGVYRRFARSIFQQYRGLPNLRYIAQTITVDSSFFKKRKKIVGEEHHVMEKLGKVLDIDIFMLDKSPIQEPLSCQVRELPRNDVIALFSHSDQHQRQRLFPEGRLLGSPRMSPCRLSVANLDFILKEDNALLVTGESADCPGTLLTYSSFYYCKRGVCYTVDICGTGSTEQLRAHLQWHVRRLAEVSEGAGTVLLVTFPASMSKEIQEISDVMPVKRSTDSHHTVVETCFPY